MVKKNSTKTKVQPYEIGELDHYLFGQGNHYEIYKKMGAHEVTKNGKRGVYLLIMQSSDREQHPESQTFRI